MEFMLIFHQATTDPEPGLHQEMGQFAGELAAQGKMRGGAPLHSDAEGARIRVQDGRTLTTDGPFSESKEVVAGFFMIECDSREEAVEIGARCPHARVGTVEVRQVMAVGPPPS